MHIHRNVYICTLKYVLLDVRIYASGTDPELEGSFTPLLSQQLLVNSLHMGISKKNFLTVKSHLTYMYYIVDYRSEANCDSCVLHE